MSRKTLAQRAAKLAAPAVAHEPDEERKTPVLREKPVSLTVQVQPALYKELKAWPDTTNISEVTGKARIPTVEVVRAALEEMLADAALQKRVAKRVIKNLI